MSPEIDLPSVIGLTGYMGAGKNTVARELQHYGYRLYGFADALKGLAARIGWDGTKRPRADYAPFGDFRLGAYNGRLLLQELGVGAREIIDPEVWIRVLRRRLDSENPARAAVTDVRFQNEADAIRAWGGIVVRIDRPGYHGDGHESERYVGAIRPDEVILNESMHELRIAVRNMLNRNAR